MSLFLRVLKQIKKKRKPDLQRVAVYIAQGHTIEHIVKHAVQEKIE